MSIVDDATARFEAAVREPVLILTVGQSWVLNQGMVATVDFARPGATARSKPVRVCPILVGAAGETGADLLDQVAAFMRQAGRST